MVGDHIEISNRFLGSVEISGGENCKKAISRKNWRRNKYKVKGVLRAIFIQERGSDRSNVSRSLSFLSSEALLLFLSLPSIRHASQTPHLSLYKTSSCRGGATERVMSGIRSMRRRGHLPLFYNVENREGTVSARL